MNFDVLTLLMVLEFKPFDAFDALTVPL